ncbi:MAG: NADH-quinone oxidoreductase subunit J [Candidatus Kapaibacterium sp.]|nr:NADH-quinone oxidoreductase subunit J [Bacteroidota bacterium]
MSLQVIMFMILGVGAIVTALGTITRRNPVASAMNLVAHFFMLSGLYLTLQAQFVAVVQVLVYAGAIMVLVVFVIMLLNVGKEEAHHESFTIRKVLGLVFAGAIVVQMLAIYLGSSPSAMSQLSSKSLTLGATESIGTVLFNQYLFPFEVISLLLLSALIGAVILAKRKVD